MRQRPKVIPSSFYKRAGRRNETKQRTATP